jgi:hypothetical protein
VLVLLLLLSNLKVKNENNSKKGVTEKVRVPLQVHFVLSFFFFFFFLVFCEIAILSFRRILFRFFILFKKKLSREKKGIWLVARARARARADFRFVRFGFWGKGERCCDCEEW